MENMSVMVLKQNKNCSTSFGRQAAALFHEHTAPCLLQRGKARFSFITCKYFVRKKENKIELKRVQIAPLNLFSMEGVIVILGYISYTIWL